MQAKLTINLQNLAKNYRLIADRTGPACQAAVVVKANAYGCGLAACAPILQEAGAREFFVATLPEALELRTILDEGCTVNMLGGFDSDHADLYLAENIVPVISSAEQLAKYTALESEKRLPAIIHFDTGMNRLGLRVEEIDPDFLGALDVRFIMSHFACSDEAGHEMNARQNDAFQKIRARFPGYKYSLANSSGIFRSKDYHYDLVRPGMALYGLNPVPEQNNPMHPVVSVEAKVLQVRTAKKGETAGYGATYRFEEDTTLAVVATGYADGFLRSLSNNGKLYWRGIACPIRGRVSMDLTIVDLCGVPENDYPAEGEYLEVIGHNQSADALAADAGTIDYELFTSLSRRYQRMYID